MTNGWVDIKNTDMMLIMGGNPAENHPCGFKWAIEAKRQRNAQDDCGRSALHSHGGDGRFVPADPRRRGYRVSRRRDSTTRSRINASPKNIWSISPTRRS